MSGDVDYCKLWLHSPVAWREGQHFPSTLWPPPHYNYLIPNPRHFVPALLPPDPPTPPPTLWRFSLLAANVLLAFDLLRFPFDSLWFPFDSPFIDGGWLKDSLLSTLDVEVSIIEASGQRMTRSGHSQWRTDMTVLCSSLHSLSFSTFDNFPMYPK